MHNLQSFIPILHPERGGVEVANIAHSIIFRYTYSQLAGCRRRSEQQHYYFQLISSLLLCVTSCPQHTQHNEFMVPLIFIQFIISYGRMPPKRFRSPHFSTAYCCKTTTTCTRYNLASSSQMPRFSLTINKITTTGTATTTTKNRKWKRNRIIIIIRTRFKLLTGEYKQHIMETARTTRAALHAVEGMEQKLNLKCMNAEAHLWWISTSY